MAKANKIIFISSVLFFLIFSVMASAQPVMAAQQMGDCTYTPPGGTSYTYSNVTQANCLAGQGTWSAGTGGTGGTGGGGGTSGTICDPATSGKICNPINVNTINDFIRKILEGVIKIGIPIVALAIIYSGFLFVSAQGNDEKLTKAKNALLYSVIGAAILLGSWAIAQLISETVIGVTS